MKKHFLFAFAAITALLMTACSEEDIVKGQGGNTVTFSVGVPQLATRAIGEGNSANKLYWGVYDHNNVLLTEISNTTEGQDFSQSGTVHLTLAQDKKYSIVFWAANKDNSMCTVDWTNRTMTVNPTTANQEAYDAFCAYVTIDNVSGYAKRDVTLYRPFAQLNIGTADVEKAGKSGLTVKNTKVEISGIPTTYNFVDGTTDGSATFTYDYPATATSFDGEVFPVNNFDYLAMNYALVAADKELVTVKFTYMDDDDQEHLRTYTSVPVQRNWRTNIYGNILTSEADFTVTIEPEFADEKNENDVHNIEVWDGKTTNAPVITQDENGEEIAVVSTGSQLAYVAQVLSGKISNNAPATRAGEAVDYTTMTIVLDADLDLGNEEWLPVGTTSNPFKGTFDGNGFTIHNLKVTGYNSNVGLFGVTHEGEIKNFILNNANVSGRTCVGAVAGQPYTSKYTDITVKGHVEVNGMAYVGAVGGKDAYANWTNITVNVDETSYVKANSVENGTAYRTYVGGVVGFNGEGGHTFKNITSNINVEGSTLDVGGLFGIAHYGNKFENCVCTGNVVNTIDKAEYALQTGGIAGVWNNGGENVEFTNCSFEGELSAPNVGDVNFYYNGLVGAPYSAAGPGKLIIDGEVAVASVEALQAAIDAAEGETTIALYADMVGDVTVVQKQGVKITINGKDKKFTGSIKVHSNSNHYADAALTIQNVNFESSAASVNFIEALENGSQRYSTNITVEGCTFTATGEGVNTSVGVQIKASKNAKVLNCTATGVHSLLQAQSCDETVVVTDCEINGKNGVAFKQVKAATVEGTTITATGYGIRFDGNTDNYGITVKNNNVTAAQPLIVRKMTGKNNTITLEGDNILNTEADYQIVITNGSDDAEYVVPTGTYTLTGAEKYSYFPAPPVAKIGDTEYTSIKEAIANWTNNTTLTLIADVTLTDVITLKSTEHHILNLGTYTMTAAEGKHAIEVTCNGRSSASYALTINADATNPGGITAKGKSCIYYKKSDSTKDRPIILINNGVFTGQYSINSTSNGNTNCPQIWINGGVFNSYMNLTKNMLKVSGGTFHGSINCTGDQSAYRQISGGRFKSWQFMTADAPSKFWVGTAKETYDVGLYVDDEGYLCVGGPVITEFGDKFAAKATNATKWSSYLKYSSAAEHGLYYTNADLAIQKHGAANVELR